MLHLSRSLKSLAVDYSLAVLITNNLVHSNRPRAALGRSWASVPNTRVHIMLCDDKQGVEGVTAEGDRVLESRRKAVLVKSTRQVEVISVHIFTEDVTIRRKFSMG